MVAPVNRLRIVPELFLGLLSLAVAAVWIGHIFASTIHEAKSTVTVWLLVAALANASSPATNATSPIVAARHPAAAFIMPE